MTIERGTPLRRRLDRPIPEFPLLERVRKAGGTDYFALALNRTFRRFPTVAWATDRPGGFSDADIAKLEAINPALAAIADTRAVRRISGNLLDTYLGPQAGRRILAGQIFRAQGERMRAVIMMTDMRDFTGLSDRFPGEEVIELLDDYFDAVVSPVEQNKGEVLKFMGDGVLAIFPAEDDEDFAPSSLRALEAATEGLRQLGGDQPGPARTRTAGIAHRRRTASGRSHLRQCRRRRSARLHGDRPRRQPRLADRGADQAAVASAPDLLRLCRRSARGRWSRWVFTRSAGSTSRWRSSACRSEAANWGDGAMPSATERPRCRSCRTSLIESRDAR